MNVYRVIAILVMAIYSFASAAKLEHRTSESGAGPTLQSNNRPLFLKRLTINAALLIDGQLAIFPHGETIIIGPKAEIGENIPAKVLSGIGSAITGAQINLDESTMDFIRIPNDEQVISYALSKIGMTLNQYIQATGNIQPGHMFHEITPGGISIDGIFRNINAGILRVTALEFLERLTPVDEGNQPPVDPVTRIITETAAPETQTVIESVTLTKTQTQDEFVTVTSPVYNNIAATITNIQTQTVAVLDEQVIRSTAAGNVVVSTIPLPFQTVLTVSARSTNMFVRTIKDEITDTQAHYVTNYSISTITVNNPLTLTVVQTITQTRVATVYNTSTVGSTEYTTTTTTVNIGTAGATTATPGGYY